MSRANARHARPTLATIRRAVEAARIAGIKVGSVEISADGAVRVYSEQVNSSGPDEFARLEAAGLL